jgi:hypothetical protein
MKGSRRLFLILSVAAATLAPARAFAYSWPIFPFDKPHPVRGNFGDPRTIYFDNFEVGGFFGPGSFSFHNGVDIVAPGGTPVYPIASGIARKLNGSGVAVDSADRVEFDYVHITPSVFDGQYVVARKTILGRVHATSKHVHLTEIRGGHPRNPLAPTHLTPYFDTTRPRVTAIDFRRGERPLLGHEVCGTVGITAEAYDRPEIPAPGVWGTMPVTPAELVWHVGHRRGPAVVTPELAFDVRDREPLNGLFWDTYARGSYQNVPRFGRRQYLTLPGKFVFWLDRAFDTRKLENGTYIVAARATDTRGNVGALTKRFTVENPCRAHPTPAPQSPPTSPWKPGRSSGRRSARHADRRSRP